MNADTLLAENKSSPDQAGGFRSRYVRFGAFHLDLQRQDLLKNGARLRLPGKVCQVLTSLLERPGEIVTREELRTRLWPSDTHVNFDANVNTTVNKLRQILAGAEGGGNDSVYVQTIPRKGYSFVSKVEFVEKLDSLAEGAAALDEKTSAPLGRPAASRWFASQRASMLFTAGVVALVIAAMLLGAALTLFSHRAL